MPIQRSIKLPIEFWDLYYEDGTKADRITARGNAIPEGFFHIVVWILLQHEDGEYLLMMRDPAKPFGGKYEATAGGCVQKGETPKCAARRELFEETGIDGRHITFLGSELDKPNQAIYMFYTAKADAPKDSVTILEGETAGYRWAKKEEIQSLGLESLATIRMWRYVKGFFDVD